MSRPAQDGKGAFGRPLSFSPVSLASLARRWGKLRRLAVKIDHGKYRTKKEGLAKNRLYSQGAGADAPRTNSIHLQSCLA